MNVQWADRALVLALCVLAAVWIQLARDLPFPVFARVSNMGPAHYPTAVAALLAGLAAILLVQTLRPGQARTTPSEVESRPRSRTAHSSGILGFLGFVAYVLVLPWLGFGVSSALFVCLLVRFPGGYGWRLAAALGLGIPCALWLLFAYLLTVPLPRGPWGF